MVDGLSKEAYVPTVGRENNARPIRTTADGAMDNCNSGAGETGALLDSAAKDRDRPRHRRLRDGKRSRR
jgi:hypothetical protein